MTGAVAETNQIAADMAGDDMITAPPSLSNDSDDTGRCQPAGLPEFPEASCLAPLTDALSMGKMIDLANLVVNDNGDIELLSDNRSCGFRFELGGVPVHVGMRTDRHQIRLTLSGDLGYLPYSIENQERRRAINAVIAATDDLDFCHFELVDHRHIMLRGHRMMPRPFQLVDMFMGLVDMVHEVAPFMELLGDCLDHNQSDIPVPGDWKPMNPTMDPAAELTKPKKKSIGERYHDKQMAALGVAAE
ncbi:MAG: hypothetical protein AAF213_10500 [Pseudomonadota bacterium]